MNPVAFNLFGIDIRWYGILIATGIFLGMHFSLKWALKKGYKEDDIINLFIIVIPCAIIGARIYYVIFNWSYYQGDFFKMINTRLGGMAIHGGLIGGFLSGYLYCRYKKINFYKLADIITPVIPLGQAIGRWGNFINQEAHGGPTNLPWGIMVDGVKVHPTFLYESVWDFCLFLFLLRLSKTKKYEGQILIYYACLYSVGRFFVEGLRTDSLMLGPLRMAQVISLVIIFVGVILHMRFNKKNKK